MATFTVIDPTKSASLAAQIEDAILGTAPGITADPSSLVITAGTSSAMFYDGSLAPLGIDSGILITSGTVPPTTNTGSAFGVNDNLAGDPDLNAVVNTVFNAQTFDATTISFSFTVSDPTITSISLDVVFGSDEYPEYVNSYVDIGAVFVNGVNYALFNNDPKEPLGALKTNVNAGDFIDNTTGVLPIEYDGVSPVLHIVAPVNQGVNTLKIGVADTGDHVVDSGLFVSNLHGTSGTVVGIVKNIAKSDFNGDGKSDVMWINDDGSVATWQMNGLAPTALTVIGQLPSTAHLVGSGDFDGDGKADILWQDSDGATSIWEVNGVNIAASAVVATPGASWHAVGTGDFNADSKSDILWQNDDGTTAIWEMDGFTAVNTAIIGMPDSSWHAIDTGDFNGDGKSDILWQNINGDTAIWEMNGTTILDSAVVGTPGPSWHVIDSGDFNGDGKSDILLHNDDGSVAIWEMNGLSTTFSDIVAQPSTDWHPKGTADLNGDGKADIIWQNNDGSVSAWLMDGISITSSGFFGFPPPSWHLQGNSVPTLDNLQGG